MADLNALIAQGYQFQAPPDPFAQYARMQQLDQGEQANQLNRMKMQEYQRGIEETNAMRRLDPTSATYLQDITRINPEKGFAFSKSQMEAKNAATEGDIKRTKLLTDKLAMLPDAYRMADTPEAYLQLHQSVHADPVLGPYLQSVGATPEKGLATLQKAVETGKFGELRMGSMQSVNQILESMKPQVVGASSSVYNPQTGAFTQAPAAPEKAAAPPVSIAEFQLAQKDPEFMRFLQARSAAQRAPATPATPAAPVRAVDLVTGKPVFVSREEALSKRMTPAEAMEGLPPKEIQKREAKYPQAKQATTTVSATMNEIDATIQRLLANEKGLNGITGLVYGHTMALTDEGRKAQADLKQLKNLAFVQGLTELRNASSTGSGVGNVSNKEGDRFENLKASLEQSQSTQDLKDSLKRLKSQANATNETIKQAFEDTYSYRDNVAAPAATPAAGGLSPAEQAELAQLRKRFGK